MTSANRQATLVLIAASCLLHACTPPPARLILQREWTPNAEFAGDVWARDVLAAQKRTLLVREGSDVIDPVREVRTGAAHFGVASADRILRENEAGATLVVLAAATYKSPVMFIARAGSGITRAEHFRSRKVGIQSGTNTELVYKSLLRKLGLTDKVDIQSVESGWGTANFETGVLDAQAVFAYDEPVQLAAKHIDFTSIDPEASGVRLVGTVYFTSGAMLRERPADVQMFVDALVSGWRNALSNQGEAVEKLSLAFPTVDKVKEAQSLKLGTPYFSGEDGRLLYASRQRWEVMAEDLIALGLLRSFDFSRNVDYRFLESSLDGSRQ